MGGHVSPADKVANDTVLRIRAVRAGDVLPALTLSDGRGARHALPAAELVLAPCVRPINAPGSTPRWWIRR